MRQLAEEDDAEMRVIQQAARNGGHNLERARETKDLSTLPGSEFPVTKLSNKEEAKEVEEDLCEGRDTDAVDAIIDAQTEALDIVDSGANLNDVLQLIAGADSTLNVMAQTSLRREKLIGQKHAAEVAEQVVHGNTLRAPSASANSANEATYGNPATFNVDEEGTQLQEDIDCPTKVDAQESYAEERHGPFTDVFPG